MSKVQGTAQAWLTSVTDDDTVTSALVLAESLRRTRTGKRIGVITCDNVSKAGRQALRKEFDDIFMIDDSLVPCWNEWGNVKVNMTKEKADEIRANIFAFSLEIFEKCVFLGANTLVLENSDGLFQGQPVRYQGLTGNFYENGSVMEMKPFIFQPSLELCGYMAKNIGSLDHSSVDQNDALLTCVMEWMKNNNPQDRTNNIPNLEASIVRFCFGKGQLKMTSWASYKQPAMVIFINAPKTDMVARMNLLKTATDTGLVERAIIQTWLNIFQERVAGIVVDPRAALHWSVNQKEMIYDNEPIAIVGMSCRFPGANNLEEFWNLLYSGEDGIRHPPTFRWKKEHSIFGGSGKERETNAGFLSVPVDEFDSKFFGVSPKEAVFLDPQARLLHEVLWESLECSGIDPLGLRGSHTGIFTGSWMNDYKDIVQTSTERDFFRTYMGNSMGATAARLSFLLGLTGPSIATESGCSSAIVAVDLAVKSLRNGETNLALAGGVNLLLHPFQGDIIEYVISPDGRCKTFDETADGFGRAEGCGVLVLKRLSDALRDRDNIWAMIRGSAISQEGLSRSLGTPTVHCEALSMELALRDAGVRPEEVSFVETHGTGTSVGDPMEVAAIAKAYHSKVRKEPLIIGSVKTNVGHTESCSGIAGIIKTVLAMQNELIPKHLNLDTLNPEVKLDAIPAMIPIEPTPWPKVTGHSRLAGVSSFGITGTDGHVIIEEAPDYELPKLNLGLERPTHLIKISARTNEALEEIINLYTDLFNKNMATEGFADLAFTANTGRASFNHRAFLLARNYDEAASAIRTNKLVNADVTGKEPGKICFLFTGQGSQYPGMAKVLYETSPVFRIHFEKCDNILREAYNVSIPKVLWSSDENSSNKLSSTLYSQTSIFCVQYCLLKLWESWGIKPDCVLGHSLGEFCAAVAADILRFEDALKLVAERSRLIDNLPGGSMLVIKASQPEVDKLIKASSLDLDFAAINSEEQTVVAGDSEKIQVLLEVCKGKGMKAIILEASHAFHSSHMDPIMEEYRKIAETVRCSRETNCQYISGVEGRLLKNPSSVINSDYWMRHTREKVAFLDACAALKEMDCQNFIEIGPQPVLSSLVMQNIEGLPLSYYPSLRRNTDDWETILTSLGKLYLQGHKINWEGYDKPYMRKKVPSSLPFHPFHRKSFWVDCSETSIVPIHPLIGSPLNNASTLSIFQNSLNVKSLPYLRDHCIGNRIVLPGAAFAEMCLSAGYCVANAVTDTLTRPKWPIALENLKIEQPLELKEGKHCRMQVIVSLRENYQSSGIDGGPQVHQGFRVKIFRHNTADSETSGKWAVHATSDFNPLTNTKDILNKWNPERVKELLKREALSTKAFYKRIDGVGLKFGEQFKSIDTYMSELKENKKDEIVAQMKIPKDHENYILHPTIIDAMLQARILTIRQTVSESLNVPVRIGQLVWLENVSKDSNILYFHACWEDDDICWIFVSNENLTPVAFMTDVEFIETNVTTIEAILEQQTRSLPDSWEEDWQAIPGPHDNSVALTTLEPILNSMELKERLQAIENKFTSELDADHARNIDRLVYLYAMKALFKLGWEPYHAERIHLQEFCAKYKIVSQFAKLIQFYFTIFEEEQGIVEISGAEQNGNRIWKVETVIFQHEKTLDSELQEIYEKLKLVQKINVVLEIYKNIGSQLSEILSGAKSALTILFPTDTSITSQAEMYYQNHPCRDEILSKVLEVGTTISSYFHSFNEIKSCTKKKVFRILEVGAGTASLSIKAVKALSKTWGSCFEFYFTDISPSFFVKAEKKLDKCEGNLKFCTFNIEESPLEQGIPLNYFDVVLATDVLHVAKNLKQCLRNLRQTIKPEGTLLFTETLKKDRGITFVFGLLESYWRFEDFEWRPHHSCVDDETWKKLLLLSGFKDVYVSSGYMGLMGCINAQASCSNGYDIEHGITLSNDTKQWTIFSPSGDPEIQRLTNVINSIRGNVCSIYPPPEIDSKFTSKINSMLGSGDTEVIIYAWGMDINVRNQKKLALPFLHIIKNILNMKKPPKLYILTRGVHTILESDVDINPSAATLFGMAKSLKNENSDLFVRYIDLERGNDLAVLTDQILFELAMNKETREKERVQVVYRDSVRYAPRFIRSTLPQNSTRDELQIPPSMQRFHLVLPETRMINDLTFDVLEEELLGENDVEVKTKAYALNFRDIFAVIKPIAEFDNFNAFGLDFSGVVTKVGRNITSDQFTVGDRVFGIIMKEVQLPSHIMAPSESIVKIPMNMTFAEACTLPAVFATSFHCLMNVAKMRKDETVLIHTGSGGVGLSAIQLAKHIGANIITTAGNPRKRAYLRSLGIRHVFHSRNTSYEQEIMKVTNGRGVDVVLNSITGPGFKEATLNICARNARFVEMSKLAIWTEEQVKNLRPDVRYNIVDLTVLERNDWETLLKLIKAYLNDNHVNAIPYVQFDALRIRQALQYFQKAKHIGKIVVTMPEVKAVEGIWKTNVPLFNGESTYLITGGLGGIGFEVCKWMLEKGARDIVLIGRSPPKPEVAKEIERLNSDRRYKITMKLCDVGNFENLRKIIRQVDGKPIRGIQHCAGVIQDNLYANQTWKSFDAAFNAKVDGTWNLHHLTQDSPLEHFVLYSSITALAGTPTQANHAAANCFEDAFAHYRYSLGLPATTINWGQWSEVGCAKEIHLSGVHPVSVKRMLNGLEVALRSQKIQVSFGDFESFEMWSTVCPIFKYYLDDRLLKSHKDGNGQGFQLSLKSEQFWQEMDDAETKEEKMNVVSSYMKVILRTALRMEADEPISEDADMQELGVDSLMLIELKNSIQSLLGSRLNIQVSMLKDCQTIRDLATIIVDKNCDDEDLKLQSMSSDEFTRLLQTDCILEESIKPMLPTSKSASKIKTVLITGVTGQLGPYILSTLCLPAYKTLEKIICIVRVKERKCPNEKLQSILESMKLIDKGDTTLIECIRGDVALPKFGLADEDYDELCQTVDAVIHLAAKSNHVESYRKCEKGVRDVRSVNVGGTINVLRFSATGKTKHVFYSSGIVCVFGGNDEGTLCDDWPEEDQIKMIVDNNIVGYPTSKYVCEMLLKQANDRGIPCKVFRFPWIMGESRTGQMNYLNNHYILRFMSYLKIKSMPTAPLPALVLPVDICAELSLQLFWNDDAPNEIYNISHPNPQLEVEFVKIAEEDFGTDIELVDWKSTEFVEKLYASDMPLASLKEIYEDVDRGIAISQSEAFKAIQGYLKSPENFFKNKKPEQFVPDFYKNMPSPMDIIRKDLAFVKSKGFFDKFGIV